MYDPNTSHLDTELIDFIDNKLDTLVKWDLVQFFYHQPKMTTPATKVASLTGRDLRRVSAVLREMAADGLLHVEDRSGVKLYRLTDDLTLREQITRFVAACDDRHFREAAIYHTVQSNR
jgi:hypothetical protein